MKNYLLHLLLVMLVLHTSCSFDQRTQADSNKQVAAYAEENHNTTDSTLYKTSLGKKLKALREKPNRIDALRIVRSTTNYGTDFLPTINLEVENTTETTIVAFEVTLDEFNYTKRFKASLKPHSTYSTTFKISEPKNISGDITLSVRRFIYSDGTMVETSNR